eukprot:gene31430-12789_t
MPPDVKAIGAVDLMLSIPQEDDSKVYDFMNAGLLDKSDYKQGDNMPAQYMFKHRPASSVGKRADY